MLKTFARRLSRRLGNVLKFLSPEELDDSILDKEKNLYKRGIIKEGRNFELFENEVSTGTDLADAITKIGYLAYAGGPPATKCAGEYLPKFAEILENQDLRSDLKIAVLKVLSIITINHLDHQDVVLDKNTLSLGLTGQSQRRITLVCNNILVRSTAKNQCASMGILRSVSELTMDSAESLLLWCIYSMHNMIVGNIPNMQYLVENTTVHNALTNATLLDWTGFSCNYAAVILKLVGIERKITAAKTTTSEEREIQVENEYISTNDDKLDIDNELY